MRAFFLGWLALCLALPGCGVKTDLVTYEAWQAEQEKAAALQLAKERAAAEAAIKAAEPPTLESKPAPKRKRKRSQ